MSRGGRRQGRTGGLYANRTDLALGPRLPVQAPTGQSYGEAGQQRAAQQAVPLRTPPTSPVPAASPVAAMARTAPPPPGHLDSPTARPDEPLTAGSSFGAGPGPEALGLAAPTDLRAEDLAAMRRYLPMLEQMASTPNASPATRTFVRRLRAALPVEG